MSDQYETTIPRGSCAVALARAGMRVFPLLPGEKRPATRRGVKDATMDMDLVRKWWSKGPWNIGIATGGGLVVIDLDRGKPWPIPDSSTPFGVDDGADLLMLLSEKHDPGNGGHWFFDTASVRTPSGGQHLYYQLPKGSRVGNSAGKVGPWIDVRGDGGYVVGPWSSLKDGGDYSPVYGWERVVSADLGDDLTNARLDKIVSRPKRIPDWLLSIIQPSKPAKATPQVDDEWAPLLARLDAASVEGDGSRWANAALQGEVDNVLRAVVGDRNHALNRAAFCLGQIVAIGALDEETVTRELTKAALTIGLTGGEHGEISPTIASGLRNGREHPRVVSLR